MRKRETQVFEKAKVYLRQTSWPIILAMLALLAVGITGISEAEQARAATSGYVAKQIVYASIGLLVFIAAVVVPYQKIGRYAYLMFALTLVLLVIVLLLPPLPGRRDARRWIGYGPVAFQPSELAKLSYVILLAWYLRYGDHYRRLRGLAVPFVLTFVPMGLILVEPDLGTSLLFLPTLYFMLFMAGAKLRHLLGIMAVATVLLFVPLARPIPTGMSNAEAADRRALAYATIRIGGRDYVLAPAPIALMKYHQIRRIDGWLRQADRRVAHDKGFQLLQSKMVLGAGMLKGSGGWQEGRALLEILPEDHTDFIFSVVGGRWGFLGCLAVLSLYAGIFIFGAEIAAVTYDPFGRLLTVGVLGMLFSQMFVNVGIRRPILLARRPFEHGDKRDRPLPVETALGERNVWADGPSHVPQDKSTQAP